PAPPSPPPAPPPAPPLPEVDEAPLDASPDELSDDALDALDAPADPDDAVAMGSPALAALQAKLRGFQDLVVRGELARAAIVATDVRATIDHFDPIAFFPAMFAPYFKALHQVIEELTPYLDRAGDPAWDALASYYRADLRGFLEG
ncbi:MAG TPA: type VI secretion system protein IglI family protein, partial [Kofleriaceae bacterium]|nr:type VI secretion system protein IglI family protein [Kofleriaceae bacterium]